MIDYSPGFWGLGYIFQVRGSVFPRAVVLAIPSAVASVILKVYYDELRELLDGVEGMKEVWFDYTTILGILLVFRNNQAYSRYWNGSNVIQQVSAAWFNAVGNLMCFCSNDEARDEEVADFQHLLVRLASILHCSALQQVADMDDDAFEVLDISSFDKASIDFLRNAGDRVEIILQWITRLIVESMESGVISAPPPVVSRVFVEFSKGFAKLNAARNIREIHFPFPYSQMVVCMVLVQWVMTVLLAVHEVEAHYLSGVGAFVINTCLWCLVYIAHEIEQPFGRDANDLPLVLLQQHFNENLADLLDKQSLARPAYQRRGIELRESSSDIVLGSGTKSRFTLDTAYVSRPSRLEHEGSPTRPRTPDNTPRSRY